jgi:hypothetical protein
MKPGGDRGRDIQSRPREAAVERAACPINRTKEETEGERMRGRRHGTVEEKGTGTCREIRWPS